MAGLQTIRIFVSSPGDVSAERSQLAGVVQELNATVHALVPSSSVVIELIRWETDMHPDFASGGGGPQVVVNSQLPEYDVFVGIMWKRFGTPTTKAGSGTEEEFRAAYEGFKRIGRPSHLLFYFCGENIPAALSPEEVEQFARVVAFRSELSHLGLIGFYPSHAGFADTVRPHLVRVLSEIMRPGEPASDAAARTTVTPSDASIVREQVRDLAQTYEHVRGAMKPGDARTRQMEVVASRMRALASVIFPLLPELTVSASPGERLAAIVTLQAIPSADWLDWLAERLRPRAETPFVGYHAVVALVTAARALPDSDIPSVETAVIKASDLARELRPDTDRQETLRQAELELAQRRGRRQTRQAT